MKHTFTAAACVLALCHGVPTWAGQILVTDEAFFGMVEVMMEAQSANVSMLARTQGALSSGSPLSFSSAYREADGAFGFAVAPGSDYMGRPLDLVVDALFDPAGEVWNMSSVGQIGGEAFTGVGVATAPNAVGAPPKPGKSEWAIKIRGHVYDYHSNTVIHVVGNAWSSDTVFQYTYDNVVVASGRSHDSPQTDGSGYRWTLKEFDLLLGQSTPPFRFEGFGDIDRATGLGQFQTITTVAEPAPLALLVTALLGLAASRRRRAETGAARQWPAGGAQPAPVAAA